MVLYFFSVEGDFGYKVESLCKVFKFEGCFELVIFFFLYRLINFFFLSLWGVKCLEIMKEN